MRRMAFLSGFALMGAATLTIDHRDYVSAAICLVIAAATAFQAIRL